MTSFRNLWAPGKPLCYFVRNWLLLLRLQAALRIIISDTELIEWILFSLWRLLRSVHLSTSWHLLLFPSSFSQIVYQSYLLFSESIGEGGSPREIVWLQNKLQRAADYILSINIYWVRGHQGIPCLSDQVRYWFLCLSWLGFIKGQISLL